MLVLSYVGILLFDTPREHMLLLKRSSTKKLYPNCLSGIGGKVEPGETPLQALLREVFQEEAPQLSLEAIAPTIQHRLTLHDIWEGEEHRMDWYTGILNTPPTDMTSEEGTLRWQATANLPPVGEWTPSAYVVANYILANPQATHVSTMLDESGPLPKLDFQR